MSLALARRLGPVTLVLTLLAFAVGVSAQDTTDFWSKYEEALKDKETGFGKRKKLVQDNKARLHEHISYQLWSIANAYVGEALEDAERRIGLVDDVTRVYEIAYRSKILEKRVEFAKSMNSESAASYAEAREKWNKFLTIQGQNKKGDPAVREDLIGLGTEIVELLEGINEDYTIGVVAELTGKQCESKEDWSETAKFFEKAQLSYRRHRRNEDENRVALLLRKLGSEHNVGPNAKKADPTKPAKVRAEPKKFEPVKLKYKKMKAPDDIPSAARENLFDAMLWWQVRLQKEQPKDWPLGSGSKIIWEGGTKFFVDLDGDGRRPKRIKPGAGKAKAVDLFVKDGVGKRKYRLFMQLLGEQEKFLGFAYNAVLPDKVTVHYSRGCYVEGAFNGIKFAIIDDNLNGRFNDFGLDMVRIGKEDFQPLSPYMDFGGTLYKVHEVKADGSSITFAEYVGDTGTLHVKWTGGRKVRPTFLIFKCMRGEFEGGLFNLANGEARKVPDGFYQFQNGMITHGKGKKTKFVMVSQGRSDAFDVAEGETVVQTMGGPYEIRVELSKKGNEIAIEGKNIHVIGALQEKYEWFYPGSYHPKVWLRKRDGATIAKGVQLGKSSQSDFEKIFTAPWYPKTLEIKSSHDAEYEFKATMTDALLGTIKSDWIEIRFVPTS